MKEEKNDTEKQLLKEFRKTNRRRNLGSFFAGLVKIVLIGILFIAVYDQLDRRLNFSGTRIEPVQDHDMTHENHGWFGFKTTDFEDAVLGENKKETKLQVEKQEAAITYTDTDAGLFDLGIFSRQQDVTAFGTGIYTIDLSQITKNDIVVDKKEYTVTVTVPHPVLDTVAIDPEKTVIASQTSGFLSFGSIKLTEEQHKQIEMKCDEKLREKLNDETCMKQAEDYARMSCADLYQPLVSKVSPAYRVVIKVKEA